MSRIRARNQLIHLQRGVFLTRVLAILAIIVAVASVGIAIDSNLVDAQTKPYQLTVRNITDRQPISPPIVVVHESNLRLLPTSAGRLEGLEEFAESGAKRALMESLRNRTGVKAVTEFGGIIQPQSQQTIFTKLRAEPGDHISVIGMLLCTNDAVTLGTAIIANEDDPAFGSGIVMDAGTEENDESRSSVPCPEFPTASGSGVSQPDTEDGEGRINPHPGIKGIGDLGAVFGWDRTVMEFVVDERGTTPKRTFEVGVTLENLTNAQPITPPVVVAHDKNVDVLQYTRPRELPGIDRLSEGGDASVLLDTLAAHDGVVSVTQWNLDGPIDPSASRSGNARAYIGNHITVLGMFACTNDAYIVASAEVKGSTIQVEEVSANASVFDSGAENNDETIDTVPCLGGPEAAFSEGPGENGRQEHPGIQGGADLDPNVHGWTPTTTALMSLHAKVDVQEPVATPEPMTQPSPEPTEGTATPGENTGTDPAPTEGPDSIVGTTPGELPDTGGTQLPASWLIAAIAAGLATAFLAFWLFRLPTRRRIRRD